MNRRLLSVGSAAALCLAAAGTASGQCVGYTITNGPATFIAGTTDTGNHADDGTTAITFPFLVSLYGVTYGGANVSSNGNIQFTDINPEYINNCLPSAEFPGPVICPLWDDQYTLGTAAGQGIFTAVSGTSPNQVFTIEWRTVPFGAGAAAAPTTNYCVIFYEDASHFDVVYQTLGTGTTDATVGVSASSAGPATQYYCEIGNVGTLPAAGVSLRFACETVAPEGTCCTAGACTFVTQINCAAPGVWTTGGACTPNPCPPPCAGETCATATSVSVGAPAATCNNATSIDDVALSCGLNGPANSHKDIWWVFNPGPSGGTFQIDTCGSAIDTIVAVFDNCTNLTELACNDDDPAGTCGLDSRIGNIALAANTDYYIAIAAWGAAPLGGAVTLNITSIGTGACCNNLDGSCTITATNGCTGGTYQGDNSACEAVSCPTGACCNNTTGDCSVGGSACPTGSTYQGAGTSCTPWPCNGACCDTVTGVCTLTAGGPCAGGSAFQAGGVCDPNPCPQPLPNDSCETATSVTVGAPAATGDTTNALDDGLVVCVGSGNDVWHSFDAGPAGGAFQIDTNTSGYDTVLALFDGCPNNGGFQLACDDDGGVGLQSLLNITLAPNQVILIRVAGFGGASGSYALNIISIGTGACCNNLDGSCTVTATNACTGGTYQGDNSTCEAVTCTTGACCDNATATCSLGGSACPGGSVYQGAGTVCANVACGTGACCNGGSCTFGTAADCASGGGTFQGHGVTCGGPFYTQNPNANTFTSIAGTGSLIAGITNTDDALANVALPFLYSYLGVSFADVNVSSNGYLQFGGANNFLYGQPIPNAGVPNNIIAALWTDLNPAAGGDVYTLLGGVSPNQTFTISWENVPQFGSADSNSFQVVLHENGNFDILYGTVSDESFGQDITIGFEDSVGSQGVNVDPASVGTGNTAISFAAANLPSPCNVVTTGACCCGSSCTITTAAACTGLNRTYAGDGTACTPFSLTAPCCRGNFNKSAAGPGAPGGVSVQDIFDFLTAYFSTDPCANTNDSAAGPGAPNGVSVQDIFDFLSAYFGGC